MSLAPLTELLRHSVLARAGFIVATVLLLAALFAPWIAPADPASQHLAVRLQRPSSAHWMGTDELGRDIFSRIIYGARISMFVGLRVVLLSLGIGLIEG